MEKYKLSHVESLILEGDKQKQKDAKYNEMLEMLEKCEYWIASCNKNAGILKDINKIIKEATQI